MQQLLKIIKENRAGVSCGIYSVCSAHPLVLEAAMEQAKSDQTPVLIEATANQVNQYGGYTGMVAQQFCDYVHDIACKVGFPIDNIILGGDHLGPVCWQAEPADSAMEKSHILIKEYVLAGFKKIHLDCSMPCAGDDVPLDGAIVAERAASLCKTAEEAAIAAYGKSDILYIIGTEVPPPGGTNEEISELEVTSPAEAEKTLAEHKVAFTSLNLTAAWQRVIGLVVQPGVEFSHTSVVQYIPKKAEALKGLISKTDNIVFEAHSTDYQAAENYKILVRDHFAILKVGPQLTFALREALYALSYMEENMVAQEKRSLLRDVCEQEMVASPEYWQKFYQVEEEKQYFYRHFSYSDRIRYYWPNAKVQSAVELLLNNLGAAPIALPLISQFMPELYAGVVAGSIDNDPAGLIKAKIKLVLNDYAQACGE